MTGIKEKTIQAYTEIGCLIKFFPISYIEKIPNKLLKIINAKADRKYIINVDTTKKINEQKISDQTKKILTVLTYNYWSSNEQKEDLKSKLCINEQAFQSKLAKQYSTENLFKSNRQTILDIDDKTEQVQVQMIQYKENFFTKFINAIKNILKK